MQNHFIKLCVTHTVCVWNNEAIESLFSSMVYINFFISNCPSISKSLLSVITHTIVTLGRTRQCRESSGESLGKSSLYESSLGESLHVSTLQI